MGFSVIAMAVKVVVGWSDFWGEKLLHKVEWRADAIALIVLYTEQQRERERDRERIEIGRAHV